MYFYLSSDWYLLHCFPLQLLIPYCLINNTEIMFVSLVIIKTYKNCIGQETGKLEEIRWQYILVTYSKFPKHYASK